MAETALAWDLLEVLSRALRSPGFSLAFLLDKHHWVLMMTFVLASESQVCL